MSYPRVTIKILLFPTASLVEPLPPPFYVVRGGWLFKGNLTLRSQIKGNTRYLSYTNAAECFFFTSLDVYYGALI